jgi:hypothetical protein
MMSRGGSVGKAATCPDTPGPTGPPAGAEPAGTLCGCNVRKMGVRWATASGARSAGEVELSSLVGIRMMLGRESNTVVETLR